MKHKNLAQTPTTTAPSPDQRPLYRQAHARLTTTYDFENPRGWDKGVVHDRWSTVKSTVTCVWLGVADGRGEGVAEVP